MVKLSMTELTTDLRNWLGKTSTELMKQPLRCSKLYCSGTKNRTQVRVICMEMQHTDAALLIRHGVGYSLVKYSAAFVRLILTLI